MELSVILNSMLFCSFSLLKHSVGEMPQKDSVVISRLMVGEKALITSPSFYMVASSNCNKYLAALFDSMASPSMKELIDMELEGDDLFITVTDERLEIFLKYLLEKEADEDVGREEYSEEMEEEISPEESKIRSLLRGCDH